MFQCIVTQPNHVWCTEPSQDNAPCASWVQKAVNSAVKSKLHIWISYIVVPKTSCQRSLGNVAHVDCNEMQWEHIMQLGSFQSSFDGRSSNCLCVFSTSSSKDGFYRADLFSSFALQGESQMPFQYISLMRIWNYYIHEHAKRIRIEKFHGSSSFQSFPTSCSSNSVTFPSWGNGFRVEEILKSSPVTSNQRIWQDKDRTFVLIFS